MKLYINVNKATFARILSGEQDEVYLKNDLHWQRKVMHPKTLRLNRVDSLKIANGTKESLRIITAGCRSISMGEGRADWGAPEGGAIVIKISDPVLLLPPYSGFLNYKYMRHRKK